MKAVVAAFNQEKALVGAFSVITNLRMELFQALDPICPGSPGAGTARVTIVTRRVTRCNGDAPRDGDPGTMGVMPDLGRGLEISLSQTS